LPRRTFSRTLTRIVLGYEFMQNEIIILLFTGGVCTLLGWILSQLTIGRKVMAGLAAMDLKVQDNKNDFHRVQDWRAEDQRTVNELRGQTLMQFSSLSSMIEKVLGTADSLIEVVKIQNAIREQELRNK
jgi:hypothetical protein